VFGVPDRGQGAGVRGGVEPHLVEVPGRGLVVEVEQGRPIRTVTAALVLLACWAVTSTSWSPINRTTASTA